MVRRLIIIEWRKARQKVHNCDIFGEKQKFEDRNNLN
jgi:predicted RNA-binding protein